MEIKKTPEKFKRVYFDVPEVLEVPIKKIIKEFIRCSGFNKIETDAKKKEIEKFKISADYKTLISLSYKLPHYSDSSKEFVFRTATEIKNHIEHKSGKVLKAWKVGQELKELGFRQHIKKICGKTYRLYKVVPLTEEKTA